MASRLVDKSDFKSPRTAVAGTSCVDCRDRLRVAVDCTLSNKSEAALKFVKPDRVPTSATAAIII